MVKTLEVGRERRQLDENGSLGYDRGTELIAGFSKKNQKKEDEALGAYGRKEDCEQGSTGSRGGEKKRNVEDRL